MRITGKIHPRLYLESLPLSCRGIYTIVLLIHSPCLVTTLETHGIMDFQYILYLQFIPYRNLLPEIKGTSELRNGNSRPVSMSLDDAFPATGTIAVNSVGDTAVSHYHRHPYRFAHIDTHAPAPLQNAQRTNL